MIFKILPMRKFSVLIMIIAAFVAFYEQSIPGKNVYVMVIAVVVFMFGMMKLSAKVPPKDKEDDNTAI